MTTRGTTLLVLASISTFCLAHAEPPPVFVLKWGGPPSGTGLGEFQTPYGLCVGPLGHVFVADTENNRIQVFDSSGVFMSAWGTFGSGTGQFNLPEDVAVAPDGLVYVADTSNHRIQKFSSTGAFILQWGGQGSGAGQFNSPSGISVGPDGSVYVADTQNHRIQKFTSAGALVLEWGSAGSGVGQFTQPVGVAVDGNDNVYVVDPHQVQKFGGDGNFVLSWGTGGHDLGEFAYPSGVAVDNLGNVYVVESRFDVPGQAHRAQKFTDSGVFLSTWGSLGIGDGQFNTPQGVAADSQGNVYVADTANHRIQKFRQGTVAVKPRAWSQVKDAYRD